MLNSRTVMDDTIVYYRGKNQKRMELICLFFFFFFLKVEVANLNLANINKRI